MLGLKRIKARVLNAVIGFGRFFDRHFLRPFRVQNKVSDNTTKLNEIETLSMRVRQNNLFCRISAQTSSAKNGGGKIAFLLRG
jgi:hypothetical protein